MIAKQFSSVNKISFPLLTPHSYPTHHSHSLFSRYIGDLKVLERDKDFSEINLLEKFKVKGNSEESTGWNYTAHGVNSAQGLKSGAVIYRMSGSKSAAQSSFDRLTLLDYYHGAPTGVFQADETLSDSMPSHGTELCAVVESMYSLNIVHEIQGDASFADRAERIAYNALPGTWSSDMTGK